MRDNIEQAHKDITWSAGQLALMLEKGKMRKIVINQIVTRLKTAMSRLEELK